MDSHEFLIVILLRKALEILEITYECTKLVKSAKLQILVSQFEGIRMLEEESFNDFYSKISDLLTKHVTPIPSGLKKITNGLATLKNREASLGHIASF
jgi:hypothetical protein